MNDQSTLRDLAAALRTHGVCAYPNEACGLVLGLPTGKTEIVQCENTHDTPSQFFRISRIEYTKQADRGKIVGIWHTHPNGRHDFSEADKVGCEVSGVPWYVMSLLKRSDDDTFDYGPIKHMEPSGFKMPYTGRPYVPGVFDCWTLVIDWFAREHGIKIRNYPYTLADGSPGATLFAAHYRDEGFVRVINETPRPGDVFFIQDPSSLVPNHAAIFVGDDRILHHTLNRLSKHDVYGGYYLKHTVIHARHKELM
ncbi:Mov34/MPN/PAD-1 family protein [Castellaniella sp.]|uniref:Mov34/MPN/PAD-1 family protein n=1 Tax=Castellaniella sp. TaxID=1955812 RepID=UPI002AFFD04A|nr:Mov34/MPN/PAD-1 family protein [Castellaniella sp.]